MTDPTSTQPKKRLLVWDLPVRVFHLLLGLGFVGAFIIANVVDDDSPVYPVHMLVGLVMLLMVVLRIGWGFFGTRHARFADFVHGPRAVVGYLRDVFRGRARRHAGHNPGSSVAIFAMLLLVLGLGITGVLVADGNHGSKDVHGALSWALLVTVVGHIVGVVLHTFKQRENITLSMVDGCKEVEPAQAIRHPRPVVALAFLALVGLWSWRLGSGFDPATRKLVVPFIGATLNLGESEERDNEGHGGAGGQRSDDDDD